jgi:hypothetical protein
MASYTPPGNYYDCNMDTGAGGYYVSVGKYMCAHFTGGTESICGMEVGYAWGYYDSVDSYSCPSGGILSGTICITDNGCAANTCVGLTCDNGITTVNGTMNCNITCTSFTYNSWGTCTNEIQTRTVASSSPSGCTGGNPLLSQSCTCAVSSWSPDSSGTCEGSYFTQTSNCNTTQQVAGTGYCPPPPVCTPTNPSCAANTCQGAFCSDGCNVLAGTKVCTSTVTLDISAGSDTKITGNVGGINEAGSSKQYIINIGTSVTLTEKTLAGTFNGWGGDGTCTGTSSTCNFVMNKNRSVSTSTTVCSCGDKTQYCPTVTWKDNCNNDCSGGTKTAGCSSTNTFGAWKEVAP